MTTDELAQLRKLRKRLDKVEADQVELWRQRRELYGKARAEAIPLKDIAAAAGVSESAVSLALRVQRDTPNTPRKDTSV